VVRAAAQRAIRRERRRRRTAAHGTAGALGAVLPRGMARAAAQSPSLSGAARAAAASGGSRTRGAAAIGTAKLTMDLRI
jgi:hypothetical protein